MYTYIFLVQLFTIMAFNNDISISGVFEHFYKQIMGVDKPQVSVLEVFLLHWSGGRNHTVF